MSLLLRAGFSLVAASGGYSSLRCAGFSLRWLLLLRSTGSRCVGFSSRGSRALEHRLSSCSAQAWLVAPWHVGSSRTRARTCVPCIGRRIFNHCATREVPGIAILIPFKNFSFAFTTSLTGARDLAFGLSQFSTCLPH